MTAVSEEPECTHMERITMKENRCLMAQARAWDKMSVNKSKCLVAELFSPPRFSKIAEEQGKTGLAFDILQGWDLNQPKIQLEVDRILDQSRPDLLVACPPCKHWGGWFRLNQLQLTLLQKCRLQRVARKQADFVVRQVKKQFDRGGRVLIEHPWSSDLWKYPPMAKVLRRMHLCRTDLCAYDLSDPDSGLPIRKPTGIAVSHQDMVQLAQVCPGHEVHKHVEGKCKDGESLSAKTSRYTESFCRTWMSCLDPQSQLCHFACLEEYPCHPQVNPQVTPTESANQTSCTVSEVLVASREQPSEAQVKTELRKLHNNLGHPTNRELIRILKNAGGSQLALDLASDFKCDVCFHRQRPPPCLPASAHQIVDFNHRVGLDVKRVQGWQEGQTVTCLNVIDYASGFQLMLPFYEVETGDVLKELFQRGWQSWAGVPVEVILDPARTNLAQSFVDPLELAGTRVLSTAAEAHNQLGKVEKHGHLFEVILQKVLDSVQPTCQSEFEQCILATCNSKNEMINNRGLSPVQHVFGRNPRIPSDLLQDEPDPVAATSPLFDAQAARTLAIRTAARTAVAVSQDDISLRTALNAKPRVERDFVAGDFVSYWRTQRYMKGVRLVGGCWYGTGIVMGKVGRNVLVFHRQNMFKVSPEHLRHASNTERAVAQSDGRELLGIKDLVADGQNLLGHQYVDLTGQDGPPNPADLARCFNNVVESPDVWKQEGNVLIRVHNQLRVGKFMPDVGDPFLVGKHLDDWRLTQIRDSNFQLCDRPWSSDSDSKCSPLRAQPWLGETHFRIVVPNTGPVSDSQTAIPMLDESNLPSNAVPSTPAADTASDAVMSGSTSSSSGNQGNSGNQSSAYGPIRHRSFGVNRDTGLIRPPALQQEDLIEVLDEFSQHGTKRSHSPNSGGSPEHKSARVESQEVMLVEALLAESHDSVESLIASFLQKKLQHELRHSNNPPALQEKVDDAKVAEFIHTLRDEKRAIRILSPSQAQKIRREQPDRIMSGRFVITEKKEDNSCRIKARWCLRGHHDPDLVEKVLSGKCHSPTLSQLGRSAILQLIVSFGWKLNLGDIKGAFLEADISKQTSEKPVFAELPPGGVPGVAPGSLVQVLGNIYGANDAPHNWSVEFDSVAQQAGFKRAKLDSCLYFCHGSDGKLQGVLGAHVDDTITGGSGEKYTAAISFLRERFPFRKWRTGEGEFLGTMYKQLDNGEIVYHQKEYAEHIRPISISKERVKKPWLSATDKEISALRAVNGALGWISSQSRPDLAVQTSMSQQAFPRPTVQHLLAANQAVRRCRQQRDLLMRVPYIPPEELTICFWSDAAFANNDDHKTQGGWLIGLTSKHMSSGMDVPVHCIGWKSYKLPRVVASTLSGEAQAFATASGMAEWSLLLLAECLDGPFRLEGSLDVLKRRPPIGITDCRSLYDHLISLGSGGTLDDKRTAIDVAIIRQSIIRCGLEPRWCPTGHMLADGLTKDRGEPLDLLRSVVRSAKYQLADEDTVLERAKAERDRRKSLGVLPQPFVEQE
eukprot:s2127_g3.t1